MNRVLDDCIGEQVGGARDGNFARSGDSANSARTGHAGSAKNCFMDAPDGTLGRSGVLLGNVVEDVLKLIYGRHRPANLQAISRTV